MASPLLLVMGQPAPGTVLFSDAFTAADGTALATYNPLWTQHVGAYTISSNRVGTASAAVFVVATVNVGQADMDVRVTVATKSASAEYYGLFVRGTDGNNGWAVQGRMDGGDNNLYITERNGGSNTNRANAAHTWANNQVLRVVATGNTITAYVDNVQIVQYTSASFNNSAIRAGLYRNNGGTGTDYRLDDFSVRAA